MTLWLTGRLDGLSCWLRLNSSWFGFPGVIAADWPRPPYASCGTSWVETGEDTKFKRSEIFRFYSIISAGLVLLSLTRSSRELHFHHSLLSNNLFTIKATRYLVTYRLLFWSSITWNVFSAAATEHDSWTNWRWTREPADGEHVNQLTVNTWTSWRWTRETQQMFKEQTGFNRNKQDSVRHYRRPASWTFSQFYWTDASSVLILGEMDACYRLAASEKMDICSTVHPDPCMSVRVVLSALLTTYTSPSRIIKGLWMIMWTDFSSVASCCSCQTL